MINSILGMTTTDIFGYAAMLVIMIAFIPQAYEVFKTKEVEGVSLATYILLSFAALLWITYGVLRSDIPIILTNIVLGTIQLSIVILKLKYSKKS